jgi:prevent-host-death family protein
VEHERHRVYILAIGVKQGNRLLLVRGSHVMKIASVADVKARLSAYIQACAEGPVILTRNGKPAAVLLAVQDEDELERLVLAYSPKFHALLEPV